MHYLTLDTNTWIYLANGTEPVKLLTYLKQEIDKNNIKLLVPETIIEEWHRNKDESVKKGVIKHFKEVGEALARISKLLGEKGERSSWAFLIDEEEEKDYFQDLIKKFKEKRKEVEQAIAENIALIDDLFKNKKIEIIPISDEVKLKAGEFALAKKAPFKNKNSFADALILFSFIEYVTDKKIEEAKFITYNTEDFCEKKNDKKYLHPDLEPDFTATKSKFYTIVGEAINTIEKDIVSKEELEWIKEAQEEAERERDIEYCEVCTENNDRANEVHFRGSVPLTDERVELVDDPDQTELEFAKELPKTTHSKFYDSIEVGHCDWCNTEHFKCAQCGTVNAVTEDQLDEKKECDGCGLPYFIEVTGDPRDGDEEHHYRILKDYEKCEKCGDEFENDGTGNNVCPKCEDEYSYGET